MNDKTNVIPVDFRAKKVVKGIDTTKLGHISSPFEIIHRQKVAEHAKKVAEQAKKKLQLTVAFGALIGFCLHSIFADILGLFS